MIATRKKGPPSVPQYRGRKNPDGFLPLDFRLARLNIHLTIRDLSKLTGIPHSTIGHIERGKCSNPIHRAVLIKELGMKKPVSEPAPALSSASKAVSADTEFAQWLIDNSTDELVVARAKYELLLAQRRGA